MVAEGAVCLSHRGGQGFESPQLHLVVFTFLWGPCSRLGLTFLGPLAAWREPVFVSLCVAVVGACWPESGRAGAGGVLVSGGLWRSGQAWSGLGGEAGEGSFPPAFACSGREAGRGPALVLGLAGVPGGEDALVADGVQGGEPERDGCEAHEAAPAAADGVAGGVLDGGEAPPALVRRA